MCAVRLVIGNKNYSSWSLRPWLHLRESRIPFEEIPISLYRADSAEQIARFSPAGRVPVLLDDDGTTVWDSLAIVEHVREHHGGVGWPQNRAASARARSITAEMHSGFLALREELPLNVRARSPIDPSTLSDGARRNVERVLEIWSGCRTEHARAGDWLFGEFSIADAFYAPVALRFVTYSIAAPDAAQSFVDAVTSLGSIREWAAAAERETESLDFIDRRSPAGATPLTFG
jgi:glutathione S-transferase